MNRLQNGPVGGELDLREESVVQSLGPSQSGNVEHLGGKVIPSQGERRPCIQELFDQGHLVDQVKKIIEARLVGPEVYQEALDIPHGLLTKTNCLMPLSGGDDQLDPSSLQEMSLSFLQHLAKSGGEALQLNLRRCLVISLFALESCVRGMSIHHQCRNGAPSALKDL